MTFRRLHAIILKFSSNTLNTVNMCVNTRVKTPSPNHLLLPGSALFMNTSITSAMQIMWAVHADTCFSNFLKHSVISKQLRATQPEKQISLWPIFNPREMPSEAGLFDLWNALHQWQKETTLYTQSDSIKS